MKHVQHVMSDPLRVPVITRAFQPGESPTEAGHTVRPVQEVLVYAPGPVPCRCGRYLSEDFDGLLFCRGCEGADPGDITPRLPLCWRPQ